MAGECLLTAYAASYCLPKRVGSRSLESVADPRGNVVHFRLEPVCFRNCPENEVLNETGPAHMSADLPLGLHIGLAPDCLTTSMVVHNNPSKVLIQKHSIS